MLLVKAGRTIGRTTRGRQWIGGMPPGGGLSSSFRPPGFGVRGLQTRPGQEDVHVALQPLSQPGPIARLVRPAHLHMYLSQPTEASDGGACPDRIWLTMHAGYSDQRPLPCLLQSLEAT